jgi:hypothetical protein
VSSLYQKFEASSLLRALASGHSRKPRISPNPNSKNNSHPARQYRRSRKSGKGQKLKSQPRGGWDFTKRPIRFLRFSREEEEEEEEVEVEEKEKEEL